MTITRTRATGPADLKRQPSRLACRQLVATAGDQKVKWRTSRKARKSFGQNCHKHVRKCRDLSDLSKGEDPARKAFIRRDA